MKSNRYSRPKANDGLTDEDRQALVEYAKEHHIHLQDILIAVVMQDMLYWRERFYEIEENFHKAVDENNREAIVQLRTDRTGMSKIYHSAVNRAIHAIQGDPRQRQLQPVNGHDEEAALVLCEVNDEPQDTEAE